MVVLNIKELLNDIIVKEGIRRDQGIVYEIVIPALCNPRLIDELHVKFPEGSVKKIETEYGYDYEIVYYGNIYKILGDFHGFKGDRDSIKDIREYFEEFKHGTRYLQQEIESGLKTFGFAYHYKMN